MSSTTTTTPQTISPLIQTTHSFISAFVAGSPPPAVLDAYFTPTACILEHGPEWARVRLPFLGREFRGRSSPSRSANDPRPTLAKKTSDPALAPPMHDTSDRSTESDGGSAREEDKGGPEPHPQTMDEYYTLLTSTLTFKPPPHTPPPVEAFMVDEEKGAVSVHFAAEWESKATGRGWREGVVYVVEFEAGDEGVGRGEDRGERGREGGMRRKIKRLDLWADALSAWVCCGR